MLCSRNHKRFKHTSIPWFLKLIPKQKCILYSLKVYPGLTPGSRRSPGEGHSKELQYSCLENSMDRGAWQVQSMGHKESGTTEWLPLSQKKSGRIIGKHKILFKGSIIQQWGECALESNILCTFIEPWLLRMVTIRWQHSQPQALHQEGNHRSSALGCFESWVS